MIVSELQKHWSRRRVMKTGNEIVHLFYETIPCNYEKNSFQKRKRFTVFITKLADLRR